jgi:periplasmic protein TonB
MMTKNTNETMKMEDIIFAQRNKDYGAYALRSTYGNTVAKSMLLTSMLFLGLIFAAYKLTKQEAVIKELISTIVPVNPIEKIVEINLSKKIAETKETKVVPLKSDPPKGEKLAGDPTVIKDNAKDSLDKKVDPEKITTIGDPKGNPEVTLPTPDPLPKGKPEGGGGETESNGKPFIYVENMPEFPGGNDKVLTFLKKNTVYPQIAIEERTEQKFNVRFTVDENGYVINPEILDKNVNANLAAEAKRVINKMPRWKAGKTNDQAVKVYFTVPFQFQLSH